MIKKVMMENLTCSNCTAKIEASLKKDLHYVNNATFNFPNQVMLIDVNDSYNEEHAIKEIKCIVDSIEEGINTFSYDKRHLNQTEKNTESYVPFIIGISLYILTYLIGLFSNTSLSHNAMLQRSLLEWYTPLFYVGYGFITFTIFRKTIKGLKRKDFFNENTLMFIATFTAMLLRNYLEASLVIIFYTVGEYLQQRAVKRSKKEISSLVDLKIDYASVRRGGQVLLIDPLEINVGDTIIVKNGDRIPVDGTITRGTTPLNTSALTGESQLTEVFVGDDVLSGNINVGNVIEIEAKKLYKDSTLAKVIDMIENSPTHKSTTETFITKFARIYTPFVTISALLLIIVKVLSDVIAPDFVLTWNYFQSEQFYGYVYDSATFLVISCPCALVLSIPLSYFAGIGTAAKKGILLKGSSYLHELTNVTSIGIDKTGTLTHGEFKVTEYSNDETLKIAASIEQYSTHPIAKSIVASYTGDLYDFKDVSEIPGLGLSVSTEKDVILVGNAKLLSKYNIKIKDKTKKTGTYVYVAKDNQYIGVVIVKDTVKDSSINTMQRLAAKYNIVMLTGDNNETAKEVSSTLGNINYRANLLPEDKIHEFNNIKTKGIKVYVGDGINDAPLLKQADIGVAMGNGSEIAIDVADMIIMGEDIGLLEKSFDIAHKTKKIAIQNIIASLGVKSIFLILAGFGISSMLTAIFADVGMTLIAVLNTFRLIYGRR